MAKVRAVAATFDRRHRIDADFEAIPIPGHTEGATAYLWDSGRHRMLFTGDTIYLRDGEWVAAVLEFSDRERYIESLELLRGLDFDVLVPWAASAGDPYYAVVENGDGMIVVRKRAGRSEDRLEIRVAEVLAEFVHELGEDAGLEKDGVERHLQEVADLTAEERRERRYRKYRAMGRHESAVPGGPRA